jgi:hypothetical protein
MDVFARLFIRRPPECGSATLYLVHSLYYNLVNYFTMSSFLYSIQIEFESLTIIISKMCYLRCFYTIAPFRLTFLKYNFEHISVKNLNKWVRNMDNIFRFEYWMKFNFPRIQTTRLLMRDYVVKVDRLVHDRH